MKFINKKSNKKIHNSKSDVSIDSKSSESGDLDIFWLIPIVIFLIVIAITDAKANVSEQKTSIKIEEVAPKKDTKGAI